MFDNLFENDKQTLNNFIEHIYYINLDSRTDRNKHITKCFDLLGIYAERFSAVRSSKTLRGCNQSHLEIIKIAKKQSYKNICIFEDDCCFDKNFNSYLSSIFTNDVDWDILFLGHCLGETKKRYTHFLYSMENIYCTHAYCLNNNIYDILIEYLEEFKHLPIDYIYNKINKQHEPKILAVYPSIVEQVPNKSDIREGPNNSNNEIRYDHSVYYIRRTT